MSSDIKKKRKRFIKLGWKLIEAKIMYYQPPPELASYVEDNMPTDEEYDKMEQEYLQLCIDLDEENTVVHKDYSGFENVRGDGMVEIDTTRPSVDVALQKLYIEAKIPKSLRRSYYTGGTRKKKRKK